MDPDELASHILMEKICPPAVSGTLMRSLVSTSGECICELGEAASSFLFMVPTHPVPPRRLIHCPCSLPQEFTEFTSATGLRHPSTSLLAICCARRSLGPTRAALLPDTPTSVRPFSAMTMRLKATAPRQSEITRSTRANDLAAHEGEARG